MTQRDKLFKAEIFARMVISTAKSLESEAKDYDTTFPIPYAQALKKLAEDFLKLK